MDIIFGIKGNILIAQLLGEVDHHCSAKARSDIDETMRGYGSKDLIIDLSRVTFMDSSGIGVLIGRKKTMDLHGGSVQAIHLSGRALQIFEKSGLTRIIELDQQDEKKTCRQTQYFG